MRARNGRYGDYKTRSEEIRKILARETHMIYAPTSVFANNLDVSTRLRLALAG